MNQLDHKFLQANEVIRRAGRVVIVIHRKPDGDAIGTASAFMGWAMQEGIEVIAFCRDALPHQYSFLPHVHEFTQDTAVFGSNLLTCVFDAGDLRYAGIEDIISELPSRPNIVNFDHHADNRLFGQVNVVKGDASSTSEILLAFLERVEARITPDMATAMLTGLMFDTSSLTNPSTGVDSVRAAAKLMRLGGTVHGYQRNILKSKSVPSLRVWGEAFSRLRPNDDLGVMSTALKLEDLKQPGVEEEQVEGISNFLDNFLDVPALLFLKETPDGKVKGSFRSSDDIDTSVPARLFGGGGHPKAAGFTVPGRVAETDHGWRVEEPKEDPEQDK